jgi:hypothetical protein
MASCLASRLRSDCPSGGYPNLLPKGDTDRPTKSFGDNAERLIKAKLIYDPDNIFSSAIPLPVAIGSEEATLVAKGR